MAPGESIQPIWGKEPGVIWAPDDLDPEIFQQNLSQIGNAPGLLAVKVGFDLAMDLGLDRAAETVRIYGNRHLPVVYDHQKGGTGDANAGKTFAKKMARAGVDAAIIFPLAGPDLERAWIQSLQDAGVTPIVGADLAAKGFMRRQGGHMTIRGIKRIFDVAMGEDVNHFIVPGQAPGRARKWQSWIESNLWAGNYALGVPRWMDARGRLTTGANTLGHDSVPIIGRAIHANPNRLTPTGAVALYARGLRQARECSRTSRLR